MKDSEKDRKSAKGIRLILMAAGDIVKFCQIKTVKTRILGLGVTLSLSLPLADHASRLLCGFLVL